MTPRSTVGVVVSVISLLSAATAGAQSNRCKKLQGKKPEVFERWRSAIEAAEHSADQKRHGEAAKRYLSAYKICSAPVLEYNLARMYQQAGACRKALNWFEAVIDRKGADSAKTRKLVRLSENYRADLKGSCAQAGELEVECSPKDVRLRVDDTTRATCPYSSEFEAGTHEIVADKRGYLRERREIDLEAGETETVEIELEKQTDEASARPKSEPERRAAVEAVAVARAVASRGRRISTSTENADDTATDEILVGRGISDSTSDERTTETGPSPAETADGGVGGEVGTSGRYALKTLGDELELRDRREERSYSGERMYSVLGLEQLEGRYKQNVAARDRWQTIGHSTWIGGSAVAAVGGYFIYRSYFPLLDNASAADGPCADHDNGPVRRNCRIDQKREDLKPLRIAGFATAGVGVAAVVSGLILLPGDINPHPVSADELDDRIDEINEREEENNNDGETSSGADGRSSGRDTTSVEHPRVRLVPMVAAGRGEAAVYLEVRF